MNNKSLDWIQALRGVAALLVVLCHARLYLAGTPSVQTAEELLLPGAMGVDLFFIISGFIMVYSTKRTDGTPSQIVEFVIKRFSRIWPVYALCTVAWIVVTQRTYGYLVSDELNHEFLKSIFFIPVHTTRGLFFDPTLPIGWTLDFEIYFYAIFAIALFFGRFRTMALTAWIAATVVILPMITRQFSIDPLATYSYSASYLNLVTSPIILEFLAGCIIAEIYLCDRIKIKNPVIAYNLIAISAIFMIWNNYSETGILHGIARWGGGLSIMVLSFSICSKTVHIPTPRILVWIGKISFSLYLTHLSTRVIIDAIFTTSGHQQMIHTWSYIALTTAFAVAVAGISHYYLEQGISEKLKIGLMKISKLSMGRATVTR